MFSNILMLFFNVLLVHERIVKCLFKENFASLMTISKWNSSINTPIKPLKYTQTFLMISY